VVGWLFVATVALGGPCGSPEAVAEAAEGGWLLGSQRQCLHRKTTHGRAARRHWASQLLLADARSRSDVLDWLTLADRHVDEFPDDAEVWMDLVHERWQRGEVAEVVDLCTGALATASRWSLSSDDPRLVQLHRYRTYAAVRSRTRVDQEVEAFARAWLDAMTSEAPTVAWTDAFATERPELPER